MASAFVHDKALCETKMVGEDTRIWAYAHVLPKAVIGAHCNIGENVFIENRVRIGDGCTVKNGVAIWDGVALEDDVFVGPNAVFTNDFRPRSFIKTGDIFFRPTLVKRGASLGANCTIVCGVTIGEYAFVAAGTVVLRDVPAHGLVLGNPGKIVGRVCYCAERLDAEDFCPNCELKLGENSAKRATQIRVDQSRAKGSTH